MSKKYIVSPYLFFNGRCEEAIQFYTKVVGAEVIMAMRYKDAPPEAKQPGCGPTMTENAIMHARISINGSTVLMSDGPCSGKFDGFSLSLTAANADEAKQVFTALSEGGQVTMPLNKTFFSPAFGMLSDKFGVHWMVYVEGAA